MSPGVPHDCRRPPRCPRDSVPVSLVSSMTASPCPPGVCDGVPMSSVTVSPHPPVSPDGIPVSPQCPHDRMPVSPGVPVTASLCPRVPQGTGSESEDVPPPHSFVNHYLSDPTYYSSWKRRAPHRYEAAAGAEGPHLHAVVTTQSAVFAPAGPGARTPLAGFSSFV